MFKRVMFFVYGVVSYLVFLATFLYAIAFVGGFAVPTQLDGAAVAPIATSLAINCLLLTVFAVQHSVMARRWFKERWTRIVSPTIERSTYVLFASLALILVFSAWRPLGIQIWSIGNPVARTAIWTLFASGWATVLTVTFLINHFDLFGLRQVWLSLIGKPYTQIAFRTPLPYRYVRHPLYFGFILAFWMTPNMTLAHFVFAAATTAYILLAIQFEERDLLHEHGAAYAQYRRNVPMIVPAYPRRVPPTRVSTGKAVASGLLAFLILSTSYAAAQGNHAQHAAGNDQKNQSGELVKIVRESTERFRDVAIAQQEGYSLLFGCVSGPDAGAMGLHYVNGSLIGDDVIDPTRPEIVIYEPLPDGRLKLTGADFLVFADVWNAHHSGAPELMGQLFHLFESPNRFGLPAFYTLHVWAWKENPNGTFVNWHPNVSCDTFSGQQH